MDAGGRYFATRQNRPAAVDLAFGKDFESNGSVSKITVAPGKDK